MKTRTSFVTNSSSSSFVVCTKAALAPRAQAIRTVEDYIAKRFEEDINAMSPDEIAEYTSDGDWDKINSMIEKGYTALLVYMERGGEEGLQRFVNMLEDTSIISLMD